MKHLLLLASFAFTATAIAQEPSMIQVRTLCFERIPSGTDKLAVIKADGSPVDLGFPESFPSAKAKVPLIEGKVVFRDPKDLTGLPVAVATIPSGLDNALVMFFPGSGEEDKPAYRTVVIDASLKGIPQDGAVVMNVFSGDVRVVVGEHRVLLPSGKSTRLTRPQERNDYNMAPVVFQAQVENEWKTVAETLVAFPPKLQQLFVSYPDSRSKRIAFRAYQIDDF